MLATFVRRLPIFVYWFSMEVYFSKPVPVACNCRGDIKEGFYELYGLLQSKQITLLQSHCCAFVSLMLYVLRCDMTSLQLAKYHLDNKNEG